MARTRKSSNFTLDESTNSKLNNIVDKHKDSKMLNNRSKVVDSAIDLFYEELFNKNLK